MISPGQWHQIVPKDFKENVKFRSAVLARCKSDIAFRKSIIEVCRQDLLFWINVFVWQFNPLKKTGKNVGPFITWDFQERALLDSPQTTGRKGILWCYENDRSAVVEKSRDMGASWLFLIFQDWMALFHDHFESLNISRNADAVDSKSRKSLFPKLRFIHQHLPNWMKGKVTQQTMYLHFEKTESEITGEASTGRAGVGGRAGVVFIDEFSKIKEDTQVREGTASTAESRFFNGTHEGIGTEFFKITQSPEFVKIRMHWTQHPAKNKGLYRYDLDTNKIVFYRYDPKTDGLLETQVPDYDFEPDYLFDRTGGPTGGPHPGIRSPWYDKKSKEIGNERGVAMELDINPLGATTQFFSPFLIRELQRSVACEPVWVGELDWDQASATPRRLIEMEGGNIRMWVRPDGYGRPPADIYAFGADCSEGRGITPSCLSGANSSGQKVFELSDPFLEPNVFAPFMVAIGRLFARDDGTPALLCWEAAGPGHTVTARILEIGYPNLYYTANEFKDGRRRPGRFRPSDKPGWYPTQSAKPHLLKTYQQSLKLREFINRSHEALEQCLLFEYGNRGTIQHGKENVHDDPSGATVNHADLVIADALCAKMVREYAEPVEVEVAKEIAPNTLAFRHKMHEDSRKNALWLE